MVTRTGREAPPANGTVGVKMMATQKTTHHRGKNGERLVTRTTSYGKHGSSTTRKPDGLFFKGDIVSTKKW
jgi:hypothetical protein